MTKWRVFFAVVILVASLPAWSWAGYFVSYPNDLAVLLGFVLYALIVGGVCWTFYGLLHSAVVKLNEWESR